MRKGLVLSDKKQEMDLAVTPGHFQLESREEIGLRLLTASPFASDARSTRFQNPLIFMCKDGILPDQNKMIPTDPKSVDALRAMGRAVAKGRKHWATILSCLGGPGVGKELSMRPVLVGAVSGMFLCVPPDKFRMEVADNVDVLVYKDGQVVKKALSPHYVTGRFNDGAGSEPLPKKRRKTAGTRSVVRYKTDIVAQSQNEQGVWVDRLSIEHKGAWFSGDDRWESLSGACRTMQKGIDSGSLEPRHYAHLWSEDLQYHIVDVFGQVEVRDGEITDDAYDAFLVHYRAAKEYMGSSYPADSVLRWVQGVDSWPGATPAAWRHEESEADPFARSRVRWYLAQQQKALLTKYNCVISDGFHLIGTTYFDPKRRRALATGPCRYEEAIWLTQSVLRIVLGDRVLTWGYEDFSRVMKARWTAILQSGVKNIGCNLKDDMNVFDVQTMGTTTKQQETEIGGGWKVTESADKWTIQMWYRSWESKGQVVSFVKQHGRRWIEIEEGPVRRGFPRIMDINLPKDIESVQVDQDVSYDLSLVCMKAVGDGLVRTRLI